MENKPKILIVHNYYQISGGEDMVVANERKMLEDNGHQVIFYSRNNSEIKEFSFLRKFILPITTIFNLRTYVDVRKIIREKQIDIVHVHNTLSLVSPAVYYAAYSMNVPVVQTIHNFRLLCPGATFYRNGHVCEDCVLNNLMCAVKHRCYRGSRVQTLICVINTVIHRLTGIYGKLNYICLTEFNREKLLKLRQIQAEKVFVKPNFVCSCEDFLPEKERKHQYMFVGRLDKLKGVDILFDAWKMLGGAAPKLIVCGTGPMENWCNQYIEQNELGMIEMRGFVSNNEARKLLAISEAFILPTRCYEGFPMSIVEAFSVGTPVVVADLGNAGRLVKEGENGSKFAPNSAKGLLQALERLTDYSDIFRKTFKKYKKEYTESQNYKLLIDIYSIVIDNECKGRKK